MEPHCTHHLPHLPTYLLLDFQAVALCPPPVCLYPSLLPLFSVSVLSVERHLGSLQVSDIINSDVMNMRDRYLFETIVFISFGYLSISVVAGSKRHIYFQFLEEPPHCFPQWLRYSHCCQGKSLLSHMLSSTLALWWSLSSYYNRCEGNLKILICILQKISNAKHAFRCMSSLEECPFRSFVLPSYLPAFLPSLPTFSSPLLLLSHSLSFFLAIKSPVLITHACNPSPRRLRQGITN